MMTENIGPKLNEKTCKLDREGNTELFFNSDVIEVEILLASGVPVNHQNHFGDTALHYVRNAEVANLLLAYGADISLRNSNEWTPLFCVSSLEIAKVLIAHGADIEAVDWNGRTPLHLANMQEIVEFLITSGTDRETKDYDGETAWNGAQKTCAEVKEMRQMFSDFRKKKKSPHEIEEYLISLIVPRLKKIKPKR